MCPDGWCIVLEHRFVRLRRWLLACVIDHASRQALCWLSLRAAGHGCVLMHEGVLRAIDVVFVCLGVV